MTQVEQPLARLSGPLAGPSARSPRRGRASVRFLAARAAQGLLVVFGAVLISFVLGSLGGNPTDHVGFLLTPAQRAALAHDLGYDRPLGARLMEYLGRATHGDFGRSISHGGSAAGAVVDAAPATLVLVGVAIAVSVSIAVLLATESVLRRERPLDRAARGTLFVMQGLPEFFVGLVLVLVFAVNLRWLPSIGFGDPRALILPATTLAIVLVPSMTRVLRSELLDVMQQEFVTGLRARGLSERRIVLRHVLRNAAPPFVTVLALQIGWLLGGTLIVESVFNWPGVGSLLFTASDARDITVVQAIVVLIAVGYVVVNLCADVLVVVLDPRIRLGGGSGGR